MYKGRTARPKLKLYSKVCVRCGRTYETPHRYSKVCEYCKLPNPSWGKRYEKH